MAPHPVANRAGQYLTRPTGYKGVHSHYFKQHRLRYYDLLQAVRENGARGEWIAFFLKGVVEVAREAAETARRILHPREQNRAAINAQLGRAAGNGHKVLDSLYDRPNIGVADVRQITGTTFASANTLVAPPVDLGVLSEITGFARNRRFQYAPYIALFTDPLPAR